MEDVGAVLYCQGFPLPPPYGPWVRELSLVDMTSHHRMVYSYEVDAQAYSKLSPEVKVQVDEASDTHGVPYESKYPARPRSQLTEDFDGFVDTHLKAPRNKIGVWSEDVVAQAFMTGMDLYKQMVLLRPNVPLQSLPLGCVLPEEERYRNPHCSGHYLRKILDDDDSHMHRCCLEYACALAAWVRKETHFRSPTVLEDLLCQKNIWQYRTYRLLDYFMCDQDCQSDMGLAFDQGRGLEWYTDCDTGPCSLIKYIFSEGVYEPFHEAYHPQLWADSTLDTLTVLPPH